MPYRENADDPRDLVPRDYRRLKRNAALLAAFLAGGAAGAILAKKVEAWVAAAARGSSSGPLRVHLERVDGGSLDLPLAGPALLHVWLQGCADCMPAFEAARRLAPLRVDGVTVVNVAFGQVDPKWAASYGLAENLAVDPDGRALVHPLGIGTFTTLLVDADGYVRLVDRPDRDGYRSRIDGALAAMRTGHAFPY